jgi:hypothetical protein
LIIVIITECKTAGKVTGGEKTGVCGAMGANRGIPQHLERNQIKWQLFLFPFLSFFFPFFFI